MKDVRLPNVTLKIKELGGMYLLCPSSIIWHFSFNFSIIEVVTTYAHTGTDTIAVPKVLFSRLMVPVHMIDWKTQDLKFTKR